MKRACLLLLVAPLVACGNGGASPETTPAASEVPAGTPVTVARVETATLSDVVSAPGETMALVEQQVRAPFSGTITRLEVVEGDRVERGATLGTLVARDSAAALDGAEEMMRSAETPQETADAQRAVALARQHLISTPLTATVSGVVVHRAAAAGDRVAEDQELVTIADARSFVFRAQVTQSDLARVHSGQAASVELAGSSGPLPGTVHGLLTGADAADLTAPVRIDFSRPPPFSTAGLFGTVHITVARHGDVPVVPREALLRDDVSGVTRLGTVAADGTLHWLEVTTGLGEGDQVEIVSPALTAGQEVVTSGQVGLDEGAPLSIQP